jgi:hypothetical protein
MKKISPEKPKSIVVFPHNTAALLKKEGDFSLSFPIENVPQLYGKNEHLTEVASGLLPWFQSSRFYNPDTGRNACKLVKG